MRFSERYGHKPIKSVVQTETVDAELKNALWSALKLVYWDAVQSNHDPFNHGFYLSVNNDGLNTLFRALWLHFFKLPLDTMPNAWEEAYQSARKFFFSCQWFEVYDFLEFVAQNHPDDKRNETFAGIANAFLEREMSAYRFVDRRIVRVVAPEEIEAIESAVNTSPGPVRVHLDQAMRLLADRRTPDYRNSVKESISAIEALVKIVTVSEKGTLGDLLKRLGQRHPVHPALSEAFSRLYGYTSDAGGIRHALTDETETTFEEAKFMLVACSAFVNYVNGLLKA